MVKNLSLKACRWYHSNIFNENIRGMTRLSQSLTSWALKSNIVRDERTYKADIEGIPVRLSNLNHFSEFVGRHPVKGYTLHRDIRKGDVVLDAGAFPGDFTIYAAKKCGKKGKVISMEPDLSNASVLEKNVKINDLDNVHIVNSALWSSSGTISFQDGKGGMSRVDDGGKHEVKTTTLDDIREKYGDLDFVKMDIEGGEIEALVGAENVLSLKNAFFSIASYHKIDGKYSYKKVESFLKKSGYRTHTGFPPHPTTYGFP